MISDFIINIWGNIANWLSWKNAMKVWEILCARNMSVCKSFCLLLVCRIDFYNCFCVEKFREASTTTMIKNSIGIKIYEIVNTFFLCFNFKINIKINWTEKVIIISGTDVLRNAAIYGFGRCTPLLASFHIIVDVNMNLNFWVHFTCWSSSCLQTTHLRHSISVFDVTIWMVVR